MATLEAGLTRDEAFALLNEHNKDPFHIEHAETVEQTMRYFAREYDPENEEFWGIVGLLHDLDWEEYPTPEDHTLRTAEMLRRYRQDSCALSDSPIGPPPDTASRPAASRPGSASTPTRSRPRT